MEKWSAQELQTWLKGSGFAKYAKQFEELDGKEMTSLAEVQLQKLTGNEAKGSALFTAIQNLKQPGTLYYFLPSLSLHIAVITTIEDLEKFLTSQGFSFELPHSAMEYNSWSNPPFVRYFFN